jgi:hypothetical protein
VPITYTYRTPHENNRLNNVLAGYKYYTCSASCSIKSENMLVLNMPVLVFFLAREKANRKEVKISSKVVLKRQWHEIYVYLVSPTYEKYLGWLPRVKNV